MMLDVPTASAATNGRPSTAATAHDRHGRPLAVGALVVEFDGEGEAGLVTDLEADRLTFAPLPQSGHGLERLTVRHRDVELIAGPVPTEDPADVDAAASWQQPTGGTARRRELAGAACTTAVAAMQAKAIARSPEAYGGELPPQRQEQLKAGLEHALHAARLLAAASGHVLE